MIVQFDDVRVIETVHNLHFGTHMLHHLLAADGLLLYLLYRIHGAGLLVASLPDSPVGSLTECGEVLEIGAEGFALPTGLDGWREEHEAIGQLGNLHTLYKDKQLIRISGHH